MVDTILISDPFDGMTLGTSIVGRVPPTTESGYAWKVETVYGTATSDGAGGVRFSAGGASIQQRSLAEDPIAVRIRWNTGGAANNCAIYIGDKVSSTIYPRDAYGGYFKPVDGVARMIRFTAFTWYQIGSDITGITYNLTNDVLTFERSGNTFKLGVNGTIVGEFTDATYPPDGTRRHHGLVPNSYVNNAASLRIFDVLDGITQSPPVQPAFTVVRMS